MSQNEEEDDRPMSGHYYEYEIDCLRAADVATAFYDEVKDQPNVTHGQVVGILTSRAQCIAAAAQCRLAAIQSEEHEARKRLTHGLRGTLQ